MSLPPEIDSSSLADILRRSNGRLRKLLIVDCRCFIDYNDSHIRSAINAFYSKLVRRRLQENKVCASYLLQQLLSCGDEAKAHMASVEGVEEDNVQLDLVLYDQQTQTPGEPVPADAQSQSILPMVTAKALVNGQTPTPPCPMTRLKRAMRCSKLKTDSSLLNDSSKFIALLLDKLRTSDKFSQVMVLKGAYCFLGRERTIYAHHGLYFVHVWVRLIGRGAALIGTVEMARVDVKRS